MNVKKKLNYSNDSNGSDRLYIESISAARHNEWKNGWVEENGKKKNEHLLHDTINGKMDGLKGTGRRRMKLIDRMRKKNFGN